MSVVNGTTAAAPLIKTKASLSFPLGYSGSNTRAYTMPIIRRDTDSTIAFNPFTTIGALEIGVMVALFLSGLLTVQVILYFQRHRSDRRGVRFLVAFCGCLDILHTIAICHALYTVTVIQYGEPQLLLVPPLSMDLTILMSGFIGPLEQVHILCDHLVWLIFSEGWFTYRLYKLTKSLPLPVFCMCLTIARFVGLLGLSAIALHQNPLPEYYQRASWLIEAILILSAVLDTTLVASLCYFLSSWRLDKSRVMHKIVNQIMTWTVQSGAVTVVGTMGVLITFLTMKDNMVYIGFFFVQPKLFSNALLLSLNSRGLFSEIIQKSNMESAPPRSMVKAWDQSCYLLMNPPLAQIAQLEMAAFPPSPASDVTEDFLGIKVGEPEFGDTYDEGPIAL
ncbi:O-methylsterigmatocystin oxidoreductase [Mycena sanguinolenta]|uniref:O-methylsterigmatocystin oxidoreductase n=1 Tax=Mycena sanguinolenta TaxID=230812 RepID=A0A8H6XSR3_9AGAR|nr:O-methylsterigmatocystin oxidoreductase [Mycena sanguinolenta]